MSNKTVDDYLTKQLIEGNIVTFRSLSRHLSLHVNVAKNELAKFYRKSSDGGQSAVVATFLLSGQSAPRRDEDEMEVDERSVEDDFSETRAPETRIVIVGEKEVDGARAAFLKLNTIHVYSLSPSGIRDASHLCDLTDKLRLIDGEKPEMAKVAGRVVSENIKVCGPAFSLLRRHNDVYTAKSTQRWQSTRRPTIAGPSNAKASEPKEQPKETAEVKAKEEATKAKPKATGKLDFSKATTKANKEKMKEEAEKNKKVVVKEETPEPRSKEKAMAEKREELFRSKSLKRKSQAVMLSESEDEKEGTSKRASEAKSNVRVKKRAILSDDEEDEAPPPPKSRKASGKAKAPEVDADLQAMMDVDDDQVERVSEQKPAATEQTEEETDPVDDDVQMDDIPPVQKKKRKTKKEVPRGRNGLRKKRVVKSRMTTDAKGYMVTEDYSEYESVDEEEPEPAPTKGKEKTPKEAKGTGSASTSKASKPKAPEKTASKASVSAKSKTGDSAKGGQKGISAFFTKPKGK
ncbi:hypothetical protein D9758_007850 [Tetrapyrgos nigripes]|uniref:DNA polymerase delta subunit 3 n=1 Tax=Tetrapyrgos nigripes TaxID=182062 RepID=A0A8H5FVI0_9AGAR|nr:hypothetical protein D9758_007850 [Tetrapyrgos nigripes]